MRVIGVRFRDVGNICYYDPDDIDIDVNDRVIVETDRGIECGRVILGARELSETYDNPLKKIIRKASPEDICICEENFKKEKEAFDICKSKIIELNLPMKLISAEYTFDNAKVLFYFTAECRVDFRELVKILASIFRVRIELRQVGVRDETKMVGGMGSCGRAL
ncbi:MAG: stage 0 sporulation protein, partial [Lachnospiraceae bacterium]